MLINPADLQQQLETPVEENARSIYLLLAHAKLSDGFVVRPKGHGVVENELRFEFCDRWYFSALLQKHWVRWYFRNPYLNDLSSDRTRLVGLFAGAEINAKNEVSFRLHDLQSAYSVLGWIAQAC